jgi:membrane-associated phospholipid phosphatase
MRAINTPLFMSNIIIVALIIQVICAIINVWWKISAHMAAIGGFSGALLVFAIIFNFNPLWWFSLLILLSGILGTSRMILRQHTLAQVVGGFVTGFLCSMIMIFI